MIGTQDNENTIMVSSLAMDMAANSMPSSSEELDFSNTQTVDSANAPVAELVCLDNDSLTEGQQGLTYHLTSSENIVGRDKTVQFYIDSRRVSRQHARIYSAGGHWWVEDLGSVNGVWVNDQRVHKHMLRGGDVIRFSVIPFLFKVDQSAESVVQDEKTLQAKKTKKNALLLWSLVFLEMLVLAGIIYYFIGGEKTWF